MRPAMRRRDLLAASGGAILGAAARGARAAGPALYRRGNDADPETLDPHRSSTLAEATILLDLFEGLTCYDAAGRIVPGAAESWTTSEDGLTWSFTLRPDGRWSNGDPVVAEDFLAGFRRILDPATGAKYANVLFPIRGAEAANRGAAPVERIGVAAPDPRRVVITLAQPTPYLLELMTHQASSPIHRPTLARHGDAFSRPGLLVSNGAYRLTDFVPNDRVTAARNPHFREAGRVRIPEIAYIPTPDLAAAVRRFAAGEIDSLSDLPADQIRALKARFGEQVWLAPALGVLVLMVNLRRAPLGDRRIRQALSLAIDREFLAEAVWGESMLPAYSLTPAGLDNALPPPEMPGRDLSPLEREDRAVALLREAGYGPGGRPLPVEIRYNTTDNNRNTMVAIADMWQPLGVSTRLVNTDAKTHFAHLRDGGPFDLARYAWIADYADPQNFLFLVESDNDGFNSGHYANPAYDALMREAAGTVDLARRAGLLHRAEEVFLADLPWIPLLHYRHKHMVSPRLRGIVPNLRGVSPTRYLWLDG
ncbi:extracellular solute-binding protein family 5 [Methylobacterium sp. 4-46]|uniref:peptide ABC transporter substrate-binding protein n=1 Tax=unclassified Methylobacterium TaxID=2615210 RepID=UPI000165CC55|nr:MULTISPECIES: peptide ABC transporter substrate-binding protein [Methylobacterium]ACA19661.1 extracellular solute-binding protein family 5 [Methylobacterium sp. 4-46]WFT78857.1 peptide ABC transporter substrate-binding protein [Methylobacterium nodulans]